MGAGLSVLTVVTVFACSSANSGTERHPDRSATTQDAGPGNVGTGGTRSTTDLASTAGRAGSGEPSPVASGGTSSGGASSTTTGGNGGGYWPTEPEIGAGGTKPCVDTSTDSDNCGKCGNRCGFVKLVSGQSPASFAIDATNLYWANGSDTGDWTLMKMPRDGGTPVALASSREMTSIAVTATNAYWTDPPSGKVMRVPIDGGTPETIASNEPKPLKIAVDAQNVYWSTSSTPDCPDGGLACASGGTLKKAPLTGAGAPQTLASHIQLPGSIAIGGTNVYWSAPNAGIWHDTVVGAVFKVSIAGGTPQALVTNAMRLHDAIAVTATHIYWIEAKQADGGGADTLFTMPIQGGPTTALAPAGGRPLSADRTNLYFIDQRVMKIPLRGGVPVALTDYPAPEASDVIGDGADVYWWSSFDGGIYTLNAPACSAGQCACPAEQSLCLGACVDLKTDAANCGACGNACNDGVVCANGHCGT